MGSSEQSAYAAHHHPLLEEGCVYPKVVFDNETQILFHGNCDVFEQ